MIIDKKYKNFILFLIVIGLLFSLCRDSILNTLKNLYNKLSNCNENFEGQKALVDTNANTDLPVKYPAQKDFPYHSENLQSPEADELYKFLQSMVSPNVNQYDLTTPYSKKYKSDKKSELTLQKFLNIKLNNSSSNKKLENIEFLESIYYFKNQMSLELVPFQIEGEYIKNDKKMGKVKLQLEISFRFDQPNSVFMSQTIFNNLLGVFKFNRITLTNHKIISDSDANTKKNLPVRIEQEKPKTYQSFDFNYTKESNLDTINSLIPDDIEITEYEKSSDAPVTSQKIRI